MPKEDLFLDNVAEYHRWSAQDIGWPHVTTDDRPGPRELGIDVVEIHTMSPQHAVSALHKAHRWYEWLENNGRFVQAGAGSSKVGERRYKHFSSPLVRALMLQAIGDATWNAQRHAQGHRDTDANLTEDDILEVAIDTMTELDRLHREHPVKVSPARKILVLRDTLTKSITQRIENR